MTDPVAIVIGAGPGTGASVARRFGRDGYDIGLIARDQDRLDELGTTLEGEGIRTGWLAVDATDPAQLRAALERFVEFTGRIDVLIHNVVRHRPAGIDQLTEADLLEDLAAGSVSLLTAVQAALPTLRAQGSGTVLTIGSGAADRPVPGEVSLGVQKAALRNLTRAMAAELGDEGIHVAVVVVRGQIAPGSALSPDTLAALLAGIAAETDGPRENWRTVVDLTPFGPNTVS
ncbi:MAG: hypothetical protein QG608_1778 [Actinomycetota bacterium]|nr:hypothetical protein [Actinomycetota bacterium]